VQWSQLLLADRLYPGLKAVDATAGNGHDSLFLAKLVGEKGHVWAFDIQAAAVAETQRRLMEAGMTNATVIHAGHETMSAHVPAEMHGQVSAIMFNLGYLPGSDRTIITRTETTLLGLDSALLLLAPSGLLTVAVYPGHQGGAEEQIAVADWAAALSARDYEVQLFRPINRSASPPECWVVWKRA